MARFPTPELSFVSQKAISDPKLGKQAHVQVITGKIIGEHPGDHNHQDFSKSTAIQMGGVLQYKWEAYCDTNGTSTDSISLSSERRGTKSIAIQIRGVLQYKLEVYCDTF